MTLKFNDMSFETYPNFKGGEKELRAKMFWDGNTRVLHGILEPGASIGEHAHTENCEVIFVLQGNGTIIDDGTPSPIGMGECTYCPKGHSHSLVNTGRDDLEFYAVVPNQ